MRLRRLSGDLLPALVSPSFQRLSAALGLHPLAETVFVYPLATGGLESPFHGCLYFYFSSTLCGVQR